MKYYAIPDLHGRLDLLKLAYAAINEDGIDTEFKVITLGDYIDRGPDSRGVLEYLQTNENWIVLKGNHEDIMVQTIHKSLNPDWWTSNGGDATLNSYGANVRPSVWYDCPPIGYDPHFIPPETVDWVNSLPLYYETEKQLFVHAGIPQVDMSLPLKDPKNEESLLWMLYGNGKSGGWRGKHVVHGHHQHVDGPHTYHGKDGGRTALDTGAYHTGRLVIGVFDDTQGPPIKILEVRDVN